MEEIAKFWEKINLMAKDQQKTILAGTVAAVDEAGRTCTLKVGNVQYEDVRLYGVVSAGRKGFCFIPKAGSYLLAGRIEGSNELFALMFTEIDKVLLTIGETVTAALDATTLSYKNDKVTLTITGTKAELTADEIVFNGGTLGGLVKIKELEKNLESLKAFAEGIHAALPKAFTAIGVGLSAAGESGKTAYTEAMKDKSVTLGKMENEKIKH